MGACVGPLRVVANTVGGEELVRRGHEDGGGVGCVSVSYDGQVIFTGGVDGICKAWSAATGERLCDLPHDVEGRTAVTCIYTPRNFTPDPLCGLTVFTAGDDGAARCWSLRSGGKDVELLHVFLGHTRPIKFLMQLHNSDGSPGILLTAALDGTTLVFILSPDGPMKVQQSARIEMPGKSSVSAMAFAPDCTAEDGLVAFGSENGRVAIWRDLGKDAQLEEQFWAHGKRALQGGGVSDLAVVDIPGEGRRLLFSASADHTLKMWPMPGHRCLHTYRGHVDPIRKIQVTLSSNDELILFSAGGKTLRMWSVNVDDPSAGTLLRTFRGHDFMITDFIVTSIFVPEAESNFDPTSSIAKKPLLKRYGTHFGHALNAPEGMIRDEVLVAASVDGTVKVWSVRSGAYNELDVHRQEITDIATAAGRPGFVVTGSRDGTSALLEVKHQSLRVLTRYRSALPYEVLVPVVSVIMDTAQLLSFGLSSLTQERKSLALRVMTRMSMLAVNGALDRIDSAQGLLQNIRRAQYINMFCFLVLAAMFLPIVWFPLGTGGIYKALDRSIRRLEQSSDYLEESMFHKRRAVVHAQPKHKLRARLVYARSLLWAFVFFLAQIASVAIFKTCFSVFQCTPAEDGAFEWGRDDSVDCFEGWHLYLSIAVGILVAAYAYTIIPFVMVGGDSTYVGHIWRPSTWLDGASALSVSLHIGRMSPSMCRPLYNLTSRYSLKIGLPFIAVIVWRRRHWRSATEFGIVLLAFLLGLCFPPFQHSAINAIVDGLRLFEATVFAARFVMDLRHGTQAGEAPPFAGMHLTLPILLAPSVLITALRLASGCIKRQRSEYERLGSQPTLDQEPLLSR